MKLKSSHIYTFCRWWSKQTGTEIQYTTFFFYAMRWKYGEVDEKRLTFICHAFYKSGYVPEFAEEYWNQRVMSFIVVGAK